jgi:hypothetical protein
MFALQSRFLVFCALALAIIGATAVRLMAIASCPGTVTNIAGKNYLFTPNKPVAVTVSNLPPTVAQSCVQTVFSNWNTADTTSNGSGVTFNVTFGPPIDPTNQVGVYEVNWGTVSTGDPGKTGGQYSSTTGYRINATTTINSTTQTTCDEAEITLAHEIGHTLGLGDCAACSTETQSVMFPGEMPPITIPPFQIAPTACDNARVNNVVVGCISVTMACSSSLACCVNSTCTSLGCTACESDCPSPPHGCIQCGSSPVILDLDGKGFHLTSATNGVIFDISGTGKPIQMGWTAKGVNNAFLALPGPDGLVHDGKQLFGNFTPQPPSDLVNPNGFAALAVYDDPKNGGNGDGVIDSRDEIFASLRLWIDVNHDGVSQPSELFTLPSRGVNSISLTYREDKKEDQFGNRFRYEARVNPDDSGASQVDRKAYDVFFVTGGSCPVPGATSSTQSVFPPQPTGSLLKP